MADRNLELALRIKSDFDKSVADLRGVQKEIDGVGKAAEQAQGKLDRADMGGKAVRQARQLEDASKKVSAAARDMVKGNFTGATEKLAEGAARSAVGFGAMGLAVGGVVGLLGLYATAVYKSYQDQQDFERALISSGNVLGATAGQLADVRDRVGEATGKYGDAKVAIVGLASSGKFAGDALQAATRAAVDLATLTGDSIESTTAKIIKLAEAPTEQLAKLNEQYHFLTDEVYEHVRSLEEQGRAEDAARVALEEFARVHEQRVQEAYEKAGYLEKAWINVKNAVLGAWHEMLNIGRTDVEARLQGQTRALRAQTSVLNAYLKNGAGPEALAAQRRVVLQQLDLVNATRQEVDAIEDKAKAQAEAQKTEDASIAASSEIHKLLDAGASKAEKFGKAVDDLKKKFQALRAEAKDGTANPLLEGVVFGAGGEISGGAFDQAMTVLQDKFKERAKRQPAAKKTDGQRADEAASREIENLRQQTALLGDLEEGERKASEAARIRYEIEEGAFKNASPALKAQLEAAAADLDHGRKQVEVAKQLVEVRLRAQALQGNGDQARLDETIKRLELLRRKALELKDLQGAADIAKLMNLEKAKSQLDQLRQGVTTFFDQVSAAEQKVTIDRENGLISSVEAQRRLLELRQQEIDYLQQQIPLLEEQNRILQDPGVAQSLEQMKLKLYELQQQGSLLQTTFRNVFEQGLGDALYNLATRTSSLKDAFLGLIQDVTQGMARLAAQQLASVATAKLMAAIFKTDGATDVGGGAAKLQTAALATSVAGGVVAFGANSLKQSAQELATAATLLIVANSMGGGFAEGGYTGDGGKYQLAGFVHRGEGVLNQEEIAALGGPGGFYALRDAIADGTLSYDGSDAPVVRAAPRYSFADGGFAKDAMPAGGNRLTLFLMQDMDQLRAAILNHPAAEKFVVATAGQNGNAIQAEW